MNPYAFGIIFSVLLSAFLVTCCEKFNILLDHPSERKEHKEPVPLVGGVILFIYTLYLKSNQQFTDIKKELPLYIVFIVGLIDDLVELRYYTKLILQFLAGLFFINAYHFVFTNNAMLNTFLTLVFFVTLLNAFNLVDGINGLLVGLAIIYFTFTQNFVYLPVLFVLFLFNVFNKLFMGDSGAFLIAYLLISDEQIPRELIRALVFFGYPMYEIASSFLRRLLLKKNPFKPDRFHLHHIGIKVFGSTFFLILAYSLVTGFILLSAKEFGLFVYIAISLLIFLFQFIFIKNSRSINDSNGMAERNESNF